jgi:hypothetical protein
MIKARVELDVKDGIRRAVELGAYESEQEFVERAALREYEERLVPAILTGEYDRGRQLSRRLTSMAERAQRVPSALVAAQQLVDGLKHLASVDPDGAREYIRQAEQELKMRPGAWAERVQAILNVQPAWAELRKEVH